MYQACRQDAAEKVGGAVAVAALAVVSAAVVVAGLADVALLFRTLSAPQE